MPFLFSNTYLHVVRFMFMTFSSWPERDSPPTTLRLTSRPRCRLGARFLHWSRTRRVSERSLKAPPPNSHRATPRRQHPARKEPGGQVVRRLQPEEPQEEVPKEEEHVAGVRRGCYGDHWEEWRRWQWVPVHHRASDLQCSAISP